MYEAEDRGAENCILSARKHLFLVNNFYPLINFAKEKRKDLTEGDRGSSNNKVVRNKVSMSNRIMHVVSLQRSFGRGSISTTQRVSAILEKVDARLVFGILLFAIFSFFVTSQIECGDISIL